jgi:preprotein translocase subunit YajC
MNSPTEVALILQESKPETTSQKPPGLGGMVFPLVVVAALFWIIMLGPERKQRKQREAMLADLKKGDKVMTTGGMYGTVAMIKENDVTLQVADGVRIRFSRSSIQGLADGERPAGAKGDDAGAKKDGSKAEPAKA